MGLFQNEIQMVEKPKNNKPDKVKIKSLNGYGAVDKLDESNTLTVKQPVANEKNKNKNQYLFKLNKPFLIFIIIYILKTMALYPASGFTGFSDSYAVPAGSSDVISTGSIYIILPTGITQQVFGTLSTALKCIHYGTKAIFYHLMRMLLLLI